MANAKRWLANVFGEWGALRRWFPGDAFARIDAAIRASEQRHGGELVFAVEPRLAPYSLLAGVTSKSRARTLFSRLRVWDTEHNIGVLIYALLAEHRVEIVADRGVLARVTQAELDAVCGTVVAGFRDGDPVRGVVTAIEALTVLLEPHLPHEPGSRDEIGGTPIVV